MVSVHAHAAAGPNGFNLTRHAVPPSRILKGGPPRNAIPALVNPLFVPGSRSTLLPDDRVLGLSFNGNAKAYPVRILNWHELVNDTLGGVPVAITYCPLCASGVAFDRGKGGVVPTFGVSGLLYNSNMLLYDHASESLWTQMGMRAITGPRTGDRLDQLPLYHGTWAGWLKKHPRTLALSFDTGHQRDYQRDPYATYHTSPRLYFPVDAESAALPRKALILGVILGGVARAYPLTELARHDGPLSDRIGNRSVAIHFDSSANSPKVTGPTGKEMPGIVSYWFAWYAFYPETTLWRSPPRESP